MCVFFGRFVTSFCMLQRKKEKRLEKQNAVKALSPVSDVSRLRRAISHILKATVTYKLFL